jgi:hypothetical protein
MKGVVRVRALFGEDNKDTYGGDNKDRMKGVVRVRALFGRMFAVGMK